jgi:hypothetical protein
MIFFLPSASPAAYLEEHPFDVVTLLVLFELRYLYFGLMVFLGVISSQGLLETVHLPSLCSLNKQDSR